jgi:hypothetical protein
MSQHPVALGNQEYRLALDLSDGIRLTSLRNLQSGDEYLKDPRYAHFGNPFTIELLGPNGCYRLLHSSLDFRVKERQLDDAGGAQSLTVRSSCKSAPLDVVLRVEAPQQGPASYWGLELENTGSENLSGKVIFPRLAGITVGNDLISQTVCLPIQIGGIRRRFAADVTPLVYPYFYVQEPGGTYAAPYAMPFFDFLSPEQNEGLFMLVLDPEVRRHVLTLTTIGEPPAGRAEVRREVTLAAGEHLSLPRTAIGVHTGDWHVVVDLYRDWLDGRLSPRDVPTWFREAATLYGVGGVGGGAAYLAFGPGPSGLIKRYRGPLDTEIASFDELPSLLDKARQMGTDIVYLWDFWQGEPETGMPPYWNKGDYVPRSDLGGPDAFRRGIEAVHRAGGRVLVYVEGFIVWKNSRLGQARGRDMALVDEHGAYYEEYANNWSMCPADDAWQQCLTEICVGLVRDMDVDGILLDSYGAQRHHTCYNRLHSHWPETDIWNKGLSAIIARLRAAIRRIKPDAVVMTESVCDLLLPVEDGSSDGSFAWGMQLNGGRIVGSPLKYAFPDANIFTNGVTLAHLNQSFALGCNLAVGPAWEEHAGYIRTLAHLKREMKDALVYGRMLPPLRPASPDVVATAFVGEQNLVVAVVNTAAGNVSTAIPLPVEIAQGEWQLALAAESTKATQALAEGALQVTLQPAELQVWQRDV